MASMWQFDDNGLVKQGGLSAPTYNDVFTKFGGQDYMTGYDPALAMTGSAGNQGSITSGIGAFLAPTRNAMQGSTNEDGSTRSLYDQGEMQDLAKRFGVDPTSGDLEGALNAKLGDYYGIGGMSAGWNPTGDARQGNFTLYQRQDGKLVPIQTQGGHLREEGNFVQEHPGVLAPFAVLGAGLAASAIGAGAAGGAGATEGAAAGGAAGGGITGTGGASGMAAYGAMPAGWSGFAGSTALGQAGLGAGYLQGLTYGGLGAGFGGLGAGSGGSSLQQAKQWYDSLPKYQQQALRGGGQNFLTSGGDPKAALRGAVTGGIGGLAGGALGSLGVPDWLAGVGGKFAGGIAGGLAGSIFGGAGGGTGGAGGGSGGGSSGGGSASAPGGSGGLAGGTTGGGSLGGPQLGAAKAQELAFLRDSYAPIAAEEQRRKLAEKLGDDLV